MATNILTGENRLATNTSLALDKNLPLWARRSNPIIRRQLGAHWRVFPPEIRPIFTWIIFQVFFLVLMATGEDVFYLFFVPFALVAAVIFPGILWIYIQALVQIASDSTAAMVGEYANDSLTLLRTTPFTGLEIILSKISATVWRRMDDLQDITTYTRTMGGLVILGMYVLQFNPGQYENVPMLLTFPMFVASLARVPLEMVMVASLGVMLGAYTKSKNSAFLATVIFTFFYFLLLNLSRSLGWEWYLQWIIDAVLPVALPALIIWGALMFTKRAIERD